MTWFNRKPTYSVCSTCKVHFEPATGVDAVQWPNLCETHRKEPRELYYRKRFVLSWAEANWEKLEDQAKEIERAQREAFNKAMQGGGVGSYGSNISQLAAQQNALASRILP